MKSLFNTLFFSFLSLFLNNLVLAQNSQDLQSKIENLSQNFKGKVGVYAYHFDSKSSVEIQSDTIFSTASIVKIPILIGIFNQIESGLLDFHKPLVYRDSIKYGGSGLMQYFKDSTQTDLRTLLALMMSYSDNTTSLWNQALAGGGQQINELLESLEYKFTRVNSRTLGREKDWEKYGWGQTTPREMSQLLTQIYQGKIFSPSSSEQMYRLLSNSFYTEYALSQIPPGINVASKQGMVNASRSEVLLVNAPEGDYVLAIFTDQNQDKSWGYENEAWALTRQISSLVYNYFNPNHPYTPPSGSEKYLEGLDY